MCREEKSKVKRELRRWRREGGDRGNVEKGRGEKEIGGGGDTDERASVEGGK